MAAHRSGDSRRLDPLSGRFTDYIVIDTETTGLSVRKGAKLIEIGAVKIRNDELVDEFDQLINPFEHVPSRITGLTGIDDGMLLGKPDVREVMEEKLRQKQSIQEYYHTKASLARAMNRLKVSREKNTRI